MIAHTRLQTMLLVDAVEERVGAPVETWPTSILKILLAFDPQMPFSEMSSQNLSLSYLAITYLFPRHVFSSPPAASFHRTSSHRESPTYTTIGPSSRPTRHDSRIMTCTKKCGSTRLAPPTSRHSHHHHHQHPS